MNAEIISVGTELLLGKVVNTDTTIVANALAGIGVNLLYATTIGDNPDRLEAATKLALSRSDLVITTGGLGPTQDDLTKQIVAKAAGVELEVNQKCYEKLLTQFTNAMADNQINQVILPVGCHVLLNDNGIAPGCVFESDNGKMVMMFPGPPRELEPMLTNYAVPYLAKDEIAVISSHDIHVFGKGEAQVATQFDHLISGTNPTVAPYANEGEMYLRVTAKADSKEVADDMCKPLLREILEGLGDYVYGVDVKTMEESLVKKLKEKNMTIATAESCTGGEIAKRITDISGSSAVFKTGIVAYSNETKMNILGLDEEILKNHGAVSAECAKAMAEGLFKIANSDLAISTTGIAGPTGGTDEKPVGLIYMALCDGKDTFVTVRNPRGRQKERIWHRYVAGTQAMDMARRYLDGINVVEVNEK